MNVKDNRKQNEKKISEIKPGTLFKYGDLYFIRTSSTVYCRHETVIGVSLSCNSRPEYNYNEWYDPIEAICVSDGTPRGFIYNSELVEVFPDAFISLGEKNA